MNNCSYIYLEKVSLQYVEHGKKYVLQIAYRCHSVLSINEVAIHSGFKFKLVILVISNH